MIISLLTFLWKYTFYVLNVSVESILPKYIFTLSIKLGSKGSVLKFILIKIDNRLSEPITI
jgi:hypothetical protein